MIQELEKAYAFFRAKGNVFGGAEEEDDELCYVLDLNVVFSNLLEMAQHIGGNPEQLQHLKNYWSVYSEGLFAYSMMHVLH